MSPAAAPAPQAGAAGGAQALAAALLSLRPLLRVLPPPVRVAAAAPERAAVRVGAIAARLGVPAPVPVPAARAGELGVFERVVSARLGLDAPGGTPDSADAVEQALRAGFDHRFGRTRVPSPDGAVLRAYAAGTPAERAVVLVPACGMPAALCERWLRRLGEAHFVLTLETRGLFGGEDGFDARPHDVAAQAADLFAVMDHFGVRRAHLLGLCGGAVVALAAAAARPERVPSLSLWHGDYALGGDAPRTGHQVNLVALLETGARDRASAAAVHTVLSRAIAAGAPPALAHLVLYPYATPELLYRYCRLNGAIMSTDVRPLLARVAQPALVVTSEDDVTSHPEGSRRVAERLPNATLHVAPHGDHLSLFSAVPSLLELASAFISASAG